MAERKHTPERIIALLRQIEVAIGNGKTHLIGCGDFRLIKMDP